MKRILVTGSRRWTDDAVIYRALAAERNPAGNILVYGAAIGADKIAAYWANEFGWQVDPYPVHRFATARIRNQHMVDLGADVCLAFALSWASGTGMCARMARRAGIPVIDHGVNTAPSAAPRAVRS